MITDVEVEEARTWEVFIPRTCLKVTPRMRFWKSK
jgi:hypothetical protein